jgi:hypothetical protein
VHLQRPVAHYHELNTCQPPLCVWPERERERERSRTSSWTAKDRAMKFECERGANLRTHCPVRASHSTTRPPSSPVNIRCPIVCARSEWQDDTTIHAQVHVRIHAAVVIHREDSGRRT